VLLWLAVFLAVLCQREDETTFSEMAEVSIGNRIGILCWKFSGMAQLLGVLFTLTRTLTRRRQFQFSGLLRYSGVVM